MSHLCPVLPPRLLTHFIQMSICRCCQHRGGTSITSNYLHNFYTEQRGAIETYQKSVCVFHCSSFLSYLTWQVTITAQQVYHFIGKKGECIKRNTVSSFSQRLSILMMFKNINGFSSLCLLDFVSI